MTEKNINEAKLSENAAIDHTDCEECMEDFLFKMKDTKHEFFIGLSTILQCLRVAEDACLVPQINDEWWIAVMNRYNSDFDYRREL